MQPAKILLIALFLIVTRIIPAQDIPSRPEPPRLVNDFAGIFTPDELQDLEYTLRYFNDTTSNQIVVVTVKSLNGSDASSFAYSIGEQWKVGQSGFNNGIVVLVKPKYRNSDRGEAFIATGYGLESVIPDATAKNIVENEMIPAFKQDHYYQGIKEATTVLMQLASGEISAKGYNKANEAPWFVVLIPFIFIVLIIVLVGKNQRSTQGIGRSNNLWTALLLGSMLNNRSHSGSWNHFSGGGSSGSSGFGGGFSGFGGGSFGGGGAGGSW